MVNRLVSVGDDFTLPAAAKVADANLPVRLGTAALNATFDRPAVLGTAVLLGDSITQRNGSGPIPNSGETATYHRAMGYFSWANLLGGKRLRMVRNAGVGGDNTAQILARVDSQVILYQPGWCFVLCGVNDGLTDMSATQSIANLSAIYDKLSAAGIRIVAMTPWPGSGSTVAQRAELFKLSEWIRAQQQVRKNFTMVDTAAVFIDPALGCPPANYAADGLHPDPDGAAVLGRAVAAAIEPQLAGVSSGLIVSNDDINVIANGMFTGNSSGTSSGWGYESLGGVATPSKVPKVGGLGEWQQITCVSGTTGFRKTSTTGFTAGTDVLYADCQFEADDDWASVKFELSLEYSGAGIAGGAVVRSADMLKANGDVASTTIPRQGVLRTPQLLVPAGTTTVTWALRFEGSGTFRVSRASVRKA